MLGFVTPVLPGFNIRSISSKGIARGRAQVGCASLHMQLKRLKWSEFEDRAAYAPLPKTWAGEFGSIGPLDPPKPPEEELPTEVLGQKYEKPIPLTITPEEEAAFRTFQSTEQRFRQEALARLSETKKLESSTPGLMSNFDPAWVYATPAVEYWRGRK